MKNVSTQNNQMFQLTYKIGFSFFIICLSLFIFIACSPKVNPYMAVGKELSMAGVPVFEIKDTFNTGIDTIYSALINTVEKDDRKIVAQDKDKYIIIVSYPFSMGKNVWGGNIKIVCEEIDRQTSVTMYAYEKNLFIKMSIMKPMMEELRKSIGSWN